MDLLGTFFGRFLVSMTKGNFFNFATIPTIKLEYLYFLTTQMNYQQAIMVIKYSKSKNQIIKRSHILKL